MDEARETKRVKRAASALGASSTAVASSAASAKEQPNELEMTTDMSAEELESLTYGGLADAAAVLLQVAQEEEQREVLYIAGFDLPIDVAGLFLDCLPILALIKCERVCKAWWMAISTDEKRWKRLLMNLSPAGFALPIECGNARTLCLRQLQLPRWHKPKCNYNDFQVAMVLRKGRQTWPEEATAADATPTVELNALLELGEAERVKNWDAGSSRWVPGRTGFQWDNIVTPLLDEYAPTTVAELEAAVEALCEASRQSPAAPTLSGLGISVERTLFVILR